jgi:hypothetical protein
MHARQAQSFIRERCGHAWGTSLHSFAAHRWSRWQTSVENTRLVSGSCVDLESKWKQQSTNERMQAFASLQII